MTGKSNRFRFNWILISMIALTLIIGGIPGKADAARKFVRFGGSNPGGSWFVIVGGLSAYLSGQLPDLNVTAIATGGSVDNNRQARKGNLDAWLTHALTAYDNWNGVGIFKDQKPFKSIRLLCGVYENHHHFVSLEKSGIKTMSDLKGKKVVMGSAGSGGAVNSENILRSIGLWDSISPQYLTWSEGGRALTDGQVDAMGASSAPTPVVVTAEALHKINLLEMTDAQFDMVLKKFPSYIRSTIPAGTYKSVEKDTPCIAFEVYWAGHEKADADSVYRMLKVAFDPAHAEKIGKIHKHLKSMRAGFEGMQSLGIPLHPGAVKFWKEQGLEIPAKLIPPEM